MVSTPASGSTQENAPRVFEEICEKIKEQVASGVLKPGHKLPSERDLAEQFQASRSAIREALRNLERSGVVELRKGIKGGTYISKVDSSVVSNSLNDLLNFGNISIEDLTESRAIIQDAVIRLACQRGTEADFDALERSIEMTERLTSEGRLEERRVQLLDYYRLLGRATHNEVMALLVGALTDLVLKLLERDNIMPLPTTIKTHRCILRHLRGGQVDEAANLMSVHLTKLHSYLAKAAKPRIRKGSKSMP
jgi:DNA-binding FadR family transcriptional regulator